MPEAISNTSPLLYLYRIGRVEWLAKLFGTIYVPHSVAAELRQGRERGFDVPELDQYSWVRLEDPRLTPSEWLALDLGPGELAAMALALENRNHILLLDDALARRVAIAAGLSVWGTLKIVLEAKAQGWIDQVAPTVDTLVSAGMWVSPEIRERIMKLAREE